MDRCEFVKASGATSVGLLTTGCISGDKTEATEIADVAETTETMTAETETETKTATETEPDKSLNINVEVGKSAKGLEVTNRELYRTNGEGGLRGPVDNKYV